MKELLSKVLIGGAVVYLVYKWNDMPNRDMGDYSADPNTIATKLKDGGNITNAEYNLLHQYFEKKGALDSEQVQDILRKAYGRIKDNMAIYKKEDVRTKDMPIKTIGYTKPNMTMPQPNAPLTDEIKDNIFIYRKNKDGL